MQAAKALLEDKLHLMKLSAHSAPRVDIDRIRADVEREVAAKLEADLQGRLRNLSESIRMESLQTIRSRDATIQVRRLLALLVQKYKSTNTDAQGTGRCEFVREASTLSLRK